jgi:alpha/beta hydrolase fold
MYTIGRDLACHGFVVLAFDYGGHGESDKHPLSDTDTLADVQAAVKYIRAHPAVDAERVVLLGHSMGSTSAAMAASLDSRICAVVSMGQKGACDRQLPRNMLYAFGLYDQYHTVDSMTNALSENLDGERIEPITSISGIPASRFSQPGNRALLVVPDGDHASEVYSTEMIPEVRNWLRQSVGLPTTSVESTSAHRIFFMFMMGLGAYMGGIILIASLKGGKLVRIVACLPAILVLLAFFFAPRTSHSETISMLLALFYIILSTGLYLRQNVGAKKWLTGLLLAAIAFSLGSLLGTADQLICNPGYILWTPLAVAKIIFHRCFFEFNILRAAMFSYYSYDIVPSLTFGILLLLEPVFPGLVWRPVGWLALMIADRIASFKLSLSPGLRNYKAVAALLALLAALVWMVAIRYRDGYLSADGILTVGIVILRMYLLPLLVLAVLVKLLTPHRTQEQVLSEE